MTIAERKLLLVAVLLTIYPLIFVYAFALGCASSWSIQTGLFNSSFCTYIDNAKSPWQIFYVSSVLSTGSGLGISIHLLIRIILAEKLDHLKIFLCLLLISIAGFFFLNFISAFSRFF